MQALYVQRPAASGGGADPALELTVANHRWLDGQPPAEMLALSIDPAPQTPSVQWA